MTVLFLSPPFRAGREMVTQVDSGWIFPDQLTDSDNAVSLLEGLKTTFLKRGFLLEE